MSDAGHPKMTLMPDGPAPRLAAKIRERLARTLEQNVLVVEACVPRTIARVSRSAASVSGSAV
jgi:hypothetical protein